MLTKQLFLCMVVRENMSGLQNKAQLPIQKHSSNQKGCDSQLDEKTLFPSLAAKCSCAGFGCEAAATPQAGQRVTEPYASKSPPWFSLWGWAHRGAFHPTSSSSALAGFLCNKLFPSTLWVFFFPSSFSILQVLMEQPQTLSSLFLLFGSGRWEARDGARWS